MKNFIEEFYYGNIEPQARSTKQNKAVQKQMKILMTNEDFLTTALSDKNKKQFLDYVNAWSIVIRLRIFFPNRSIVAIR